MKLFTKTIMCAALAIFSFAASAQTLSGRMLVTARIDGMQAGVNTKAMGVATVMLSPGLDTACITVSWNGLSGAVTGIHIHDGMPGQAGSVVNDLDAFVSGNRVSTMYTGASLTKQWIGKLLSSQLYINIHTAANAGGEIRGQLMPSTDWSFAAPLDSKQAGTTSTAYGLGVFNLSADRTRMWYQVVVQGLSDPISGIHLHKGAPGQSGGAVVDLTGDTAGNVVSGWITVDSTLLKDLLKGDIYVNVHNKSNAGGEIRGQLFPPRRLMASSWLDGKQAGVTTSAKGVASVQLNITADTLWYDVVLDGLSGAIGGIHFHLGVMGQSGSVVADLGSGINGNHVSGILTGTNLNAFLLAGLVRNAIYINVHTANNAGGEIRGQVMSLAREGFTISMDPKQNNLTGGGMGSGYVSIDAMGLNAEVLVVMDNMTEQPTGIHFHTAPKGSSGGVLADLGGWFMKNAKGGTVRGYWENNAATAPLTWADVMLFWHDSVYINAHTTANAGGEIRGQVWLGSGCYATTTGIENIFYNTNNTNFSVYPNPASDIVNLVLPEGVSKGTIAVYDATGRMVNNQSITNQNQINASNLQTGIYYIRANSGDKTYTANFIKK